MVHKALEDIYDMLLFLGGILGMLIIFLLYWKSSFQIRYAELILREFAEKVSITGKITEEEYEKFFNELYSIDEDVDLKMQCITYLEQPVYSYLSEEEWKLFFQIRNQIEMITWKEYELPLIQGKEEELKLQQETNFTVLAAEQRDYLPVPSKDKEPEVIAVRPEQELYVDEHLVTLCKVLSSDANYYVEAPAVIAKKSGTVYLQVFVEEKDYSVPVEVICHPRTKECENGHNYLNTREHIEIEKQTGHAFCPYCKIVPERISGETTKINLMTGDKLSEDFLRIKVNYPDGSIEYVTPESEEWQDNYDKGFCGTQVVTIRYRGKETQIMIITENEKCKKCGKKCNDRSLEDYLDYPYCIECLSGMLKLSGKTKAEERTVYKKELLSELDEKREFLFQRGDFVVLELKIGKRKTIVQRKISIAGVSRK